jgi:copper chaperone NosL
MRTRMRPVQVLWVAVVVVGMSAAACGRGNDAPAAPIDIASGTSCALDGMLLGDYPGPKAQIHYAGQEAPDFFCDIVEMFNVYLEPEQVRDVRALFVQDMSRAEWDRPRGHWIDARSAFFVVGSRRHGSMGPTIASFAAEADARSFAAEYGGDVLPFTGVTADKVRLDGGALHDGMM